MASDDAEPVSGELEVLDRVLTRMAASEDAPGAAVAVAQAAFPVPLSAEHAVLAREDVFADALTGGPLAGSGGPVLLTAGDRLDPRVREELERVLPPGATVYLLGGPAALAERVAESVRARWNVVRLAGADRTATAAAVAARVVARTGSTTALVARAGPDAAAAWADAIAGGAYGAATGVPVLLTATAALSPPTAAALRDLGIRSTVILGGSNAVGDAVERELPGPRRIAGGDRTATAVAVATQLWGRQTGRGGDAFVLANGYDADAWTLALAATPLAARQRAPLLLSDSEDLQHATRDYLAALRYGDGRSASGWVLGGLAAVSDAVLVEATRLLQ